MNFSAGILALILVASLRAETQPSGWEAVNAIAAGTRIEIVHGALKRSNGTMVSCTDTAVTIETGAGTTVIPRSEVKRASVIRHSRKKRTLVGMAIGAGAGAAIMAIGAQAGDIDLRYDYLIGGGAVLGGAIGAGVGSLVGGPVTVYRTP